MELQELETPALFVDLDRMDRNLDRIATYAAERQLALRPHVKTHKSVRVAREQMSRGAIGLTCATLREAEAMSSVSTNILVAYPLVGPVKLRRLFSLPETVTLTVAVDSLETLSQLGRAASEHRRRVGIYIEFDAGARRVGVATPADAVSLASAVSDYPFLDYRGISFYPGHIRDVVSSQTNDMARLRDVISSFVTQLTAKGLQPAIVSGGSTPTLWQSHELVGVNEIRPGTSVYNDRTTAEIGACTLDECALTVIATVVSTAVDGQAVVDAGSKALGREPLRGTAADGFGIILDHPEVVVKTLTEEHGVLDLTTTSWSPRVGDVVRIVPNHVCIVVHLNDVVHAGRDSQIVESWPVDARGRARQAYR